MIETDLLELKKEVDEAKNNVVGLKGQQTALFKQLKDDWGCKTIEEAEKKVKSMGKEIDTLQEQIETGIEELEQKYEL
jgi:uncharacterized protein YaaN involved in tellurite resistance